MRPDKTSKRSQEKAHRRKARRGPKSACVVYGLYDANGCLRYIGQTRQLLSRRMQWFDKQIRRSIAAGKRLSPVEAWINRCNRANVSISIAAIDAHATWDVSEIIHIDRARQKDINLLNILRGGNDTIDDLKRSERNAQELRKRSCA